MSITNIEEEVPFLSLHPFVTTKRSNREQRASKDRPLTHHALCSLPILRKDLSTSALSRVDPKRLTHS